MLFAEPHAQDLSSGLQGLRDWKSSMFASKPSNTLSLRITQSSPIQRVEERSRPGVVVEGMEVSELRTQAVGWLRVGSNRGGKGGWKSWFKYGIAMVSRLANEMLETD